MRCDVWPLRKAHGGAMLLRAWTFVAWSIVASHRMVCGTLSVSVSPLHTLFGCVLHVPVYSLYILLNVSLGQCGVLTSVCARC